MNDSNTEKFTPRQLTPALVTACNLHFAAEAERKAEAEEKRKALQDEMEAFTAPMEVASRESHDALWAEIYAAHPDLDSEEAHSIDIDYLEQGIVMLVKTQ